VHESDILRALNARLPRRMFFGGATLAFGALVSACWHGRGSEERTPTPITDPNSAFLAWAREAAVRIEDPTDGSGNAKRVGPLLDGLIGGKRVAYLGEADHWIHEKYAYRSLFADALFSRGWTHFGEEFAWFDGLLVDRYLETGDESLLDRITMFGYRGADRPERDDTPTGLLRSGWDTYPTAEFKAEQIRFARTLRGISEARPAGMERLRFFGFDVDYNPNAGYEPIAAMLASAPPSLALEDVRAAIRRVDSESMADEATRLSRALETIDAAHDALAATLGERSFDDLRYAVLTMRDSFEYASIGYPATEWRVVADAMAKRELVMHRHLDRVLGSLPPDGKIALMAHNMHLAKNDRIVKSPPEAVGPGGGAVAATGTWLNDRLPGQVLSVWLLFDHGTDNQPSPNLPTQLASPAGSLNALLAQVAPAFVLPTHSNDDRARPLASVQVVSMLYNYVWRTALREQADLVFFMGEVSPLRGA